ncbi:NAD-dependent epimerase/dehydratase family protein [Paucibacter sp. APW11]|uniref:NAD-dependent epimerase/dehydratase family protein n=1 Tax=Roseateles aquae TaxID=3077235 RepID=A0ABU3P8R3_9BURK|nr:NAD-dependent epimerase/dehydratase family protein [Paucibacter sp. APW11]MDT8998893.1 NAD-dependent epimerase/dehydratase family protein [Paucibacter sp. APW11]
MKILLLGGTQFVGRHLVEAALARGHELTLFNRGTRGAALFPGVEQRHGDRRVDLSALSSGTWDAVIDCCGYLPREVQASVELLAERVERYAFISSVSAYASFAHSNAEDSPLGQSSALEDPATEEITAVSYGPLKAACEAQVLACFGAPRSLIIRPALVVGPHDHTERFPYWPARVARAQPDEPLLVPAPAEAALQWIDARDLAAFTLDRLEQGQGGVFNLATTPGQHRFADLLAACVRAADHAFEPAWQWMSAERLADLGVRPWQDLPLWLPAEGDYAAFLCTSNAAALAAGLQLRSIDETVSDTLAWWRGLPESAQGFSKAGLSTEREQALLAQASTQNLTE